MIAGRCCNHSPGLFALTELRHQIVGTAELIGAGALQVLALKPNVATGLLGEPVAFQHWGLNGNPRDSLLRELEILKGGHGGLCHN